MVIHRGSLPSIEYIILKANMPTLPTLLAGIKAPAEQVKPNCEMPLLHANTLVTHSKEFAS